jgi:hypothetical protein
MIRRRTSAHSARGTLQFRNSQEPSHRSDRDAGLGPAINIRGRLTTNSGDGASVEDAAIRVLAAGGRAPLVFGSHESLADFELQLSYEDPAARSYRVDARWLLEHRSYRHVQNFNPLR